MEMELKKSRKNREKFDFDGNSHENYDKFKWRGFLYAIFKFPLLFINFSAKIQSGV